MSDDVREIKSRLDIAEVIGDYVELRRRGSSMWGLCPFHSERTPSFSVSPERGTYHCFGCGKGGDLFTFIMEIEGVDFPDALRMLADRAGVVLSGRRRDPAEARADKSARGALELAAAWFRSYLEGQGGEAARAYLERRGLGSADRSRFEIGWAPPSWDALSRHLASQGVSRADMIASGLVSEGDRGSYDRFRGRVMFPVRDEIGKLTGFGGRLIDGDGAKYVNSPEGALFSKRRLLYLLDGAKRTIRDRRRAILTEGYMDAIRAHLCGHTETVASLGTSLTEEQAALIKRFTDMCIIVYDGDGAGRNASIRGMYILRDAGVEVRVASLPDGRDPDDVLSGEGGREIFEEALRRALPLPLYHTAVKARELASPETRREALDDLLDGLASFSPIELTAYVPQIARALMVTQDRLEKEIDRRRRKELGGETLIGPTGREPSRAQKMLDVECAIIGILWQSESARSRVLPETLLPFITDEAAGRVAAALLSGEEPEELEERWRAIGDRECPDRIARGNALASEWGMEDEHLDKLIETASRSVYTRRYEELKPIVAADRATAEETAEFFDLAKKLKGGVRYGDR